MRIIQTTPPSIFVLPEPRIEGGGSVLRAGRTALIIYNRVPVVGAFLVRQDSSGHAMPNIEQKVRVLLGQHGSQRRKLQAIVDSLQRHGVDLDVTPRILWDHVALVIGGYKFTTRDFWRIAKNYL